MVFNALMFRNVSGSPSDPVSTWHHEVIAAILSYGGANEYSPVINEIFADPWGAIARSVEEILEHIDPEDEDEPVHPGTAALFSHSLRLARQHAEEEEASAVAAELGHLVDWSGLSRADFASRLGTTASRLSTYLSTKVSPRASLMVRARRIAGQAARRHP